MIINKDDLKYAIAEEAKKFKGIIDRCRDAAREGGEEEKKQFETANRTYSRKIALLKVLSQNLKMLTLEQAETDFENIRYSA